MYHPPQFKSGTIARYLSEANRQTSLAIVGEQQRKSLRRVHVVTILIVPAVYFVRNVFVDRGVEGRGLRFRSALCESIALLLFIVKCWEYQASEKLPGGGRPPVTTAELDRYTGV
jgi:hypothetical protein